MPANLLPGMLALEMLGRRAPNDHPNNFSRSPPYTDDVKWLLGLAAKLGNTSPPQDHCPPCPLPTFLSQTSFLALAELRPWSGMCACAGGRGFPQSGWREALCQARAQRGVGSLG